MNKLALIFAVALASAATAHAEGKADYGSATASANATKRIAITPSTKSVNVTDGETVEFTVDGKSFAWSFQTYPNENQFPLSKIAPEDAKVDGVRVYVARNPLYRNY
jgi:hypothetical protein